MANLFASFARPRLAIDLGTSATRLHTASRITPLTRPSVIWRSGSARPALRQGVVVDADAASDVLAELLRKLCGGWRRPHALACVPTDANEEERAAVVDAVRRAGAASVEIVEEPVAAVVGAGVAPDAPHAQALVDIGEGVTDCAVVRGARLLEARALRVAVADLRAAAQQWIEAQLGLRVSPVEAERALREAGIGRGRRTPRRLHVVGRPGRGAGPLFAWLDVDDLLEALDPVVGRISEHVSDFVKGLGPELAAEVADSGVCLSGGGALLGGMVERLVAELDVALWRAPHPLLAVVEGARVLSACDARAPAPA